MIKGYDLIDFNSHNISTTNIVNGKPLYYYKDYSGFDINGALVGQLILANCSNIEVRNLQIEDTTVGIEIAYSINISLTNNTILSSNIDGFYLTYSSHNNVSGNTIKFL